VLVVRNVAGPTVVRRRETVVLSAPGVTPSTSASHSARNCRGACTARSPSSRRWLALGTSIIDPSGVTPHTAPRTRTEAGLAPRVLTGALSHLARRLRCLATAWAGKRELTRGEPGVPDADRQNPKEPTDSRFGEVSLEARAGEPTEPATDPDCDPDSPVRRDGVVKVGREHQLLVQTNPVAVHRSVAQAALPAVRLFVSQPEYAPLLTQQACARPDEQGAHSLT
jgi:hypothetical protein